MADNHQQSADHGNHRSGLTPVHSPDAPSSADTPRRADRPGVSRFGSSGKHITAGLARETPPALSDWWNPGERRPETTRMIALIPGATPLVRPPDAIQFGLDSTRAGIINGLPVDRADPVARVFTTARTPTPDTGLIDRLTRAGLDRMAARVLVDDLLGYGILAAVPQRRPGALVIGSSALAEAVVRVIDSMGMQAVTRLGGADETATIVRSGYGFPVVPVDCLHRYPDIAAACVRRGGTVIPAAAVDGRGIIGPVRYNGQGPCPLCAVFHAMDTDPLWLRMARNHAAQPTPVDPVVLSVTAGRVAAMVALAQQMHLQPASRIPAGLSAGTMLTVDPFRFFTETDTVGRHPRCPVCFGGQPTGACAGDTSRARTLADAV